MDSYHVTAMAEHLIKAGLIPESKLAETIEALSIHWKYKIAVIWGTDDVLGKAQERDMDISEESADDILDRMHSSHDASVGINWDVIDVCLDDDEYQEESEINKVNKSPYKDLGLMVNDELETEGGKNALQDRLAKGE